MKGNDFEVPSILVVDADRSLRTTLVEYLAGEGMRVCAVGDIPAARMAVSSHRPDVVIMDVSLPGEDGLSLVGELHRSADIGIIILSGKDEVIDRVAGLEVGADDYVSKPFHHRELLARVRSLLRRTPDRAPFPALSGIGTAEQFGFAGWTVDSGARTLQAADGSFVELSAGEFEFLLVFLRNPKRVLTRDQILDLARDRAAAPFDRSVDVQVGRLRRKIETNPHRPELIKTVRSVGYMFAADVIRRGAA